MHVTRCSVSPCTALTRLLTTVACSVAREQKYTRTIEDAGNAAEFGETLSFNLDCQPTDLVHIKAKHDSNFVDTTIGQLIALSSQLDPAV